MAEVKNFFVVVNSATDKPYNPHDGTRLIPFSRNETIGSDESQGNPVPKRRITERLNVAQHRRNEPWGLILLDAAILTELQEGKDEDYSLHR